VSDDAAKRPVTDKTIGDKPEGKQFKTGVAVGIGSAAIVAALLYARSNKPRKK
jgi:hypothetical protein